MRTDRLKRPYFVSFFLMTLFLNRGFSPFLSCLRTSKGASKDSFSSVSLLPGWSPDRSLYTMAASSTGPRAMALETYFFTVKVKQVHLPTSLFTVICSSSLSMICLAMERPSPVPPSLRDLSVLKKRSNTWTMSSGAMPQPESHTDTCTSLVS